MEEAKNHGSQGEMDGAQSDDREDAGSINEKAIGGDSKDGGWGDRQIILATPIAADASDSCLTCARLPA